VKGAWVADGYYKVQRGPESFTEDGWFRTGDVVTIDEDGFVQIADRTKDLVKSGGEWISSVALEGALMAHAGVLEAAVIAIPDERWGERPLAVVVREAQGESATPAALREHLRQHFAAFWIPEHFAFLAEIPKTSVGKFDKKVLRHRFATGELEVVSTD
jgi:fatty-acyl-CoA synthase